MNRSFHVVHVVPTLQPGGMEFALARVVNGLIPYGTTHSIIALKGDAIIRDRFDLSVRIHCMHAGPHDPHIPFRLRRLIKNEAPSVIHARNLGAWPEIAFARLMTYPLVPIVFSFHGIAEVKPVPMRWRLLSRMLSMITTHIFTVSEGSKQFLVHHLGLCGSDIDIIPNGVDTRIFYPKRDPRHTGGPLRIGTVGSLSPVKNQALLIRACFQVLNQGIDVQLDIAGEGRERQALEKLIDSLGLTRNVRLLGHVKNIQKFLNNLDIFVLPSDSEAHPNALSEAMACGLPCIATRVGGIPEITDKGRAALLFEAGDEVALVKLLLILATDHEKRKALGAAAVEFISKNYSMEVMLKNYFDLYQSLVEAE
ncbi:glycosyltransferase [Sulfuricystis multivorans]|uniref:glycosyltransferase n=1 Tax=Sulfuricystis multivorans TaxID=2211108 RepID=UPI000F81A8B9|nr:glycosyltransferase [Sulfuricystis multivorans]